jgi:hypothetical protein
MGMNLFSKKELALFKKLNTPAKVQDFLNGLPFNFEPKGETVKSPLLVLRTKSAHCLEGAILGAFILSRHGFPPLLVHLEAAEGDFDHVIALFRAQGRWGALSKTNHAVLRFREPVYRDLRELSMSYFHEYFLDNGQKTLRGYSRPLNLNIFGKRWVTDEKDLWYIDKKLDKTKHHKLLPPNFEKKLRRADAVERKAGKIVEYKK